MRCDVNHGGAGHGTGLFCEEERRPVELTRLQRLLLVRAANTERNLLLRLYGRDDPRFTEQVEALNTAIDQLEGVR